MLIRPTTFQRATVTQEIRPILGPSPVREGYRSVQVLTPDSPDVFLSTEPGKTYGTNQTYAIPKLPPGNAIGFCLLPDQQLFAACNEGKAEATIIVEYHSND